MKKIIFYFLILAIFIYLQNCAPKKPAWLSSVENLMSQANQTLENLIQRAEQAKKVEEYIVILNDYSKAISEIGQQYKNLTEKYPEINDNKSYIEKELSTVFFAVRTKFIKLAQIVQTWQKENKNDKKLQEAIKNAAQAATLVERQTRPLE